MTRPDASRRAGSWSRKAGTGAPPPDSGRIPRAWWLSFAGTLIVLALAPLGIGEYKLSLLVIYALLALSLAFVWGMAGILCFGQAAFFGLGAYTYAITAINVGESTLAVILGVIVAGLVALALGAMMFYGRIGDVYLGVITLVATLILFKYANSTAGDAYAIGEARLGGFNGIPGYPVLNVPGLPDVQITGLALYFVALAALLLSWLMFRWLATRRFGRLLAGIRENELRSELSGHDARLAKTLAFGLGGAIAGLAGVLYACWAEIVTPEVFSLGVSAEVIVWVLVGGLGTLWGPMAGAMLLGALKGLLGSQHWIDNSLIMGLLLIAVVLLVPGGLLPALLRGLQRRQSAKAGSPEGSEHEA